MQQQSEVTKAMNDALDVLAQRFGTTVAHLWDVVVRQVYVTALTNAIMAVTLGIASYWLYRLGQSRWALYKQDTYSMSDFTAVLSFLGCGGAGVLAVVNLINLIGRLLNPEFYALRFLLGVA